MTRIMSWIAICACFAVAQAAPPDTTPRESVGQLGEGAVLELAVDYQRIVATRGNPRDNH
jgi:hypothetical protein